MDSYPTVEKYGLIFTFLGDIPEAERCPILPIPEYGPDGPLPGWTATIQQFAWNFDYKRSMENGIDAAHNEYVHDTHGFSGERADYRINPEDWRWLDDEWSTGFFSTIMAPPLPDQKMREASGRETNTVIEAGTGHHGVSMLWTYIYPTPAIKIHQYLFEAPIDEAHTSLYLVNLRNFLTEPEHDARIMGRNEYVALQDRDVLHDVRPVLTPEKNTGEFFTPADRSIAIYREKLKRWETPGLAHRRRCRCARPPARGLCHSLPRPARGQGLGAGSDSAARRERRSACRSGFSRDREQRGARSRLKALLPWRCSPAPPSAPRNQPGRIRPTRGRCRTA